MATKKDFTELAHFLYETGTLRKTARSHRQTLLTDDLSDNIASHSFRVAVIGFLLAEKENADPNKTAAMCLFHDIGEARSGDQNWIHKKYVKTFDDEILNDQLSNVSQKALNIANEYEQRDSIEAKIAKDADLIDQILLLKEYEWTGNKEATRWLRGKEQGKRLFTNSAKKLVKEICSQEPSSWWNNLWTAERRK